MKRKLSINDDLKINSLQVIIEYFYCEILNNKNFKINNIDTRDMLVLTKSIRMLRLNSNLIKFIMPKLNTIFKNQIEIVISKFCSLVECSFTKQKMISHYNDLIKSTPTIYNAFNVTNAIYNLAMCTEGYKVAAKPMSFDFSNATDSYQVKIISGIEKNDYFFYRVLKKYCSLIDLLMATGNMDLWDADDQYYLYLGRKLFNEIMVANSPMKTYYDFFESHLSKQMLRKINRIKYPTANIEIVYQYRYNKRYPKLHDINHENVYPGGFII